MSGDSESCGGLSTCHNVNFNRKFLCVCGHSRHRKHGD
nr:MAG TPA: hypothetical protein [Caudoviricetes sp.]